jgi:hypothetical protein
MDAMLHEPKQNENMKWYFASEGNARGYILLGTLVLATLSILSRGIITR